MSHLPFFPASIENGRWDMAKHRRGQATTWFLPAITPIIDGDQLCLLHGNVSVEVEQGGTFRMTVDCDASGTVSGSGPRAFRPIWQIGKVARLPDVVVIRVRVRVCCRDGSVVGAVFAIGEINRINRTLNQCHLRQAGKFHARRVLRTGKCPAIHGVTDQFLLARVTQFWIRVTRAGQQLYFRELRTAASAEVWSQHLPEMRSSRK